MSLHAIRSRVAVLTLVTVLTAGPAAGIVVLPRQALAGHSAGAGCPHDHETRTSSTCRRGVPNTTCQGSGRCQQQVQCNCVFKSEAAAAGAADDLLTNFEAILAAGAIADLGPTIACPKLSALRPLLAGWNETFASYAASPRCTTGLAYVSSDFMRDVDVSLQHLPQIQSLASSCGLSAVLPVLSELLQVLLSAQSCHLAGIPSQIQNGQTPAGGSYSD